MHPGNDRNTYPVSIQAECPTADEDAADFELMDYEELRDWRPWREPQYELNYLKYRREGERPLDFLVRVLRAQVDHQRQLVQWLEDRLPDENVAARLDRERRRLDPLEGRLRLREEHRVRWQAAYDQSMTNLPLPTNWY